MGVAKIMIKTDSGLEEQRPVFTCDCGCKSFDLKESKLMEVDFSIEGAIQGHPHLRHNILTGGYNFNCRGCGELVPAVMANEMFAEVL